ncbi:MAG: ABC transporter ATP-binding protein [Actinobacteria bacterium]|jgi:ATP-binding cassette subfamily B protein|nr:ABC transporter ATP-binding protein [Actinomycetota bacterium]
MRLVSTLLRPYWKLIAVVFFLVLVRAVTNLYLPTLNADIINDGVAKGDTGYIWRVGGYMLGVTVLQIVVTIIASYQGAKVAMSFGRDARSSLFRKVESFSQGEINRFGTPSLITRVTNDVQQVQMVVAIGLSMMLFAPMTLIGGLIMALRQDIPLSVTLAVILPVMLLALGTILWRALPLFRSMQKKIDRLNQVMRESLSGVRVIRAFARTQYEARRFEEANQDLTNVGLKVMRLFAIMFPTLFWIMNISTVAIMWYGAVRVDSLEMPIGNLTAFIMYVMQILFSIMMASMLASFIPRAAASASRIQEVLDVEPAITDPANPVAVPSLDDGRRGVVEFKDVEFRYPGAEQPVLDRISFTARPGETTAIVGSTGSGKSTLISLIPRLYDVTSGSVSIDGVDVRDMDRSVLWEQIGFVPQKSFLFSGTIAGNLRYGDETATDEDLWRALEIAQSRDFVEATLGGLDEPITQGGTNVSGGQRQRLAIARALARKANVYVFDDSLSALDFKTDSQLRAALKRELTDATMFVVAQRVSSIMHAEQIIVLDQGTIVGLGTHDDLMKTCQTYQEIVYSQLSAEEAA